MKDVNVGLNIIPLSGDTDGLKVNGGLSTTGSVGVGTNVPSANVHVKTSTFTGGTDIFKLESNVDRFIVRDDGFVGVGISTQFDNEKLRVAGRVSFSSELSLLNEPFNGAAIAIPDNQGVAIGGTFRLGTTSGKTYIDAATLDEILFRDGSNNLMGQFQTNAFSFFSNASNVGTPIKNYELNIYSQYWDGSASQFKESQIKHNITSAPSGDSQLDFSIGGTDIVSMLDGGDVGIGTNVPAAKVHIKGAGTGATTAALFIQNSDLTPLVVVEDGGDVGIGTNVPTDKLEVVGNIQMSDTLKFGTLGTIRRYVNGGLEVTGGQTNGISFVDNYGDTFKAWVGTTQGPLFANVATGNGIGFRNDLDGFYWGNGGGATTVLASTGKLGLGELTPTAKLHVKGAGAGATTDALLIQNSDSTNLMVVEDGGDVGIGTVAPDAKLHVNGGNFKVTSPSTDEFFYVAVDRESIGINNDISHPAAVLDVKGSSSSALTYTFLTQSSGNIASFKVNNLRKVSLGNAITALSDIDASLHVKAASGKIAIFEVESTNIDSEVTILHSEATGVRSPILKLENDLGTTLRLYSYGSAITSQPFLQNKQAIRYTTDLTFNISNTPQAILTSTGNFGIGLGLTLPTARLHVDGSTNLDGSLTLSGLTTTPAAGYVLQSTDASGNADWVDVSTLVTGGTSGTVTKYAANSAFTASVGLQIDHNIGSEDVIVQVKDSTGKLIIPNLVDNYQTNSVDIEISTTGTYRVIVTG